MRKGEDILPVSKGRRTLNERVAGRDGNSALVLGL